MNYILIVAFRYQSIFGSNPADILSRERLFSESSELDFCFGRPKFFCIEFQFDSVGQNSCFVDHADASSQLCLLAQGESAQENYVLPKAVIRQTCKF